MEKKHIDDIIKKYGNLLYRAVYVQVGNRHDTQDILQEATGRRSAEGGKFQRQFSF